MRGGELQHHLLDPHTGRPARSRWSDVTVVAASCMAADVAAKTAFLLSDEGPGWIEELGLAARFLAEDGEISTWPFDCGRHAWYVARAGGLTALVLLTLSVSLGLALSLRAHSHRWPRFAIEDVHRFAGT